MTCRDKWNDSKEKRIRRNVLLVAVSLLFLVWLLSALVDIWGSILFRFSHAVGVLMFSYCPRRLRVLLRRLSEKKCARKKKKSNQKEDVFVNSRVCCSCAPQRPIKHSEAFGEGEERVLERELWRKNCPGDPEQRARAREKKKKKTSCQKHLLVPYFSTVLPIRHTGCSLVQHGYAIHSVKYTLSYDQPLYLAF